MKKCGNCKKNLSLDNFGTHNFKGKKTVYLTCFKCRLAVKKYSEFSSVFESDQDDEGEDESGP